jgi:hypothetical protein
MSSCKSPNGDCTGDCSGTLGAKYTVVAIILISNNALLLFRPMFPCCTGVEAIIVAFVADPDNDFSHKNIRRLFAVCFQKEDPLLFVLVP